MKRNVAIWMHGGVGGGFFSQGQPNIVALVEALSLEFQVTVYSKLPAGPDFSPTTFRFWSAPESVRNGLHRWFYLLRKFKVDHHKQKTEILYAFWGFPAGFLTVLLGKIFGIPSVVHLQGGDVVYLPEVKYGIYKGFVRKWLIGWTYLNATELIVLSRFQNNYLQSIVERPVHIVPYGVDPKKFPFVKKELTGSLHCLHVGSLIPVKGQDIVLECFKFLLNRMPAELVIAGVGPREEELRRACKSLGIDKAVNFTGFHSHLTMHQLYRRANVMIHTSLYESQCMALTEAAASGVLMAGTAVGILADLGEAYGVCGEPESGRTLAEKILSLHQDVSDWNARINAARHWSEEHSAAFTVLAIKKILSGAGVNVT